MAQMAANNTHFRALTFIARAYKSHSNVWPKCQTPSSVQPLEGVPLGRAGAKCKLLRFHCQASSAKLRMASSDWQAPTGEPQNTAPLSLMAALLLPLLRVRVRAAFSTCCTLLLVPRSLGALIYPFCSCNKLQQTPKSSNKFQQNSTNFLKTETTQLSSIGAPSNSAIEQRHQLARRKA